MGDEYIAYVLCSRRRSYNVLNKSRKKCNLEKPQTLYMKFSFFKNLFIKKPIVYYIIFQFLAHFAISGKKWDMTLICPTSYPPYQS